MRFACPALLCDAGIDSGDQRCCKVAKVQRHGCRQSTQAACGPEAHRVMLLL